jgi:hypothetical protein
MPSLENTSEHTANIFQFCWLVIFYGLLGSVVGGFNEKIIESINYSTTYKRLNVLLSLVTQLLLNAIELYILFNFTQSNSVVFDDWLWNTFAGFIFGVTLFNSQLTLGISKDLFWS